MKVGTLDQTSPGQPVVIYSPSVESSSPESRRSRHAISKSIVELEFVVLAATFAKTECLRNMLLNLPISRLHGLMVPIYCGYSQGRSGKRDLQRQVQACSTEASRKLRNSGVITILEVRLLENLTDLMIKDLSRALVDKTSRGMRLWPTLFGSPATEPLPIDEAILNRGSKGKTSCQSDRMHTVCCIRLKIIVHNKGNHITRVEYLCSIPHVCMQYHVGKEVKFCPFDSCN